MLHKLIKKSKKSKRGFTLIELIVVVAILAILAAVLVPMIGGQIGRAQTSAGISDADAAFMAASLYQSDAISAGTGAFPYSSTGTATYALSNMWGDGSAAYTAMIGSPEFSNIAKENSFALQSISVDVNGGITQVIIKDNNTKSATGGEVTYPAVS
jgi:prepilin-type N-terminal cleavage/methylation domain-containing protein